MHEHPSRELNRPAAVDVCSPEHVTEMDRLGWMRQSRIVPDHCRVEVLVGYDAIFVDVEGAETGDRLLYFRLCQLTKRARKAAIVLPPGLVVLQYPFGHPGSVLLPARPAERNRARRPTAPARGSGGEREPLFGPIN